MAQQLEFRRIVLGLANTRPNHGMRLAAEMAHLLQLDLFGLFVEDESLRGLAALPFVREFQLLGGGWRPLDIDRLSRDLEIAAKNAEKFFANAAKDLRTTCQFEVVRGSMAGTIASVSRAGDIVLIAEPVNAADRVTPQFFAALDAAFHSAAAVLLVPRQIVRESGAIVAIARDGDDPSIQAASAVAAAAKEELISHRNFGRQESHFGKRLTCRCQNHMCAVIAGWSGRRPRHCICNAASARTPGGDDAGGSFDSHGCRINAARSDSHRRTRER